MLNKVTSPPRGEYSKKFYTGKLHPEVQPLTFEHSILIEKVPFGIQILLLFGQFWPTTTAYSRIPTAEPSIAAHRKGKHSLSIYAVKKRKNQVKRKKAKISAKENKFPVSKGRFVVVFIFFYFLSIYKTWLTLRTTLTGSYHTLLRHRLNHCTICGENIE